MANEYSFANADSSELTRRKRVLSVTKSTLSARQAEHADKYVKLDRAAGITVTLPRATGSGDVYRFMVGTTLTSNNYKVQVANAADFMRGKAWLMAATNASFSTANTGTSTTESDTVTLNGGTTGGVIGDYIEVCDIAKNVWQVECSLVGSGTAATPFSVAV
jgi:hypothetical protein